MLKSTCCSCTGPGSDSQHPCGDSYASVTHVPWDPRPSAGLQGTSCTCGTHAQAAKHSHIKLKKLKTCCEWPGVVLHACNGRIWEAEAGARPASVKLQFKSAGLCEISIKKKNKNNCGGEGGKYVITWCTFNTQKEKRILFVPPVA